MERLHNLLIAYNQTIPVSSRYSWTQKYLEQKFPSYWYIVYDELSHLNRSLHILEIGAGQGDVTSIACYLGFKNITSYERIDRDAFIANKKLETLFGMKDIVKATEFPNGTEKADVLIIVNCVYADGVKTKKEYINKLKNLYDKAGCPKYILLEVIDVSYDVVDEVFPHYVRLSENDILLLFPQAKINSVETYRYPINKRTKRLYIIQN